MFVLLQLIALGVFGLLVVTVWNAMRSTPDRIDEGTSSDSGPIIDGAASEVDTAPPSASPTSAAADALRQYEKARNDLKAKYPALFAMLGGYLNAHTIGDHGGVEGAVKEMIADWTPRREEVARDLAKFLADAESEEAARAFVLAACDADFEQEGYRSWLSWLLTRFTS